MIPSRYCLAAVCALSLLLARRRPALRPAAIALTTLVAINFSRRLGLPARLDTPFLWCMWPAVPSALAWSVWSVNGGRWVAIAFAFYAGAIALVPWSWAAHPWAWSAARTLPYVVAPLVGVVAWALKDEGPDGFPSSPSSPPACPLTRTNRGPTEGDSNAISPAAQASRRVAAILLASATIDVIVLLPSLNAASWHLAAPLAWCTWIACGLVIVMGARRPRVVD